MALSDDYGDLIKFIAYILEEPITKQCLDTQNAKNATYIINTSAESIADVLNFYFETKTLTEINVASFILFYAGKTERQ